MAVDDTEATLRSGTSEPDGGATGYWDFRTDKWRTVCDSNEPDPLCEVSVWAASVGGGWNPVITETTQGTTPADLVVKAYNILH